MKKLAIVIAVMLAGLVPVAAQNATIKGVIGAQIEAFQADDFAKAFSFASPSIKQIFGNSDVFGQMVRDGYPMVWRPRDVQFLGVQDAAGAQMQRVMIRDATGAVHMLDYEMVRSENGWQINGVYLLETPEIGV